MELAGVKMLPLIKKKSIDNLKDAQFATAVKSYQNNMFRLSKSILRNDQDAMDAVGEAILKAYSGLASLRSFDSFKPWIMKIVVNESYIIAKKRAKIDYEAQVEACDEAIDNLSTYTGLLELVNKLDDEFRTVVLLFYYEDMSLRDISKTLNISVGTVKSRLSRARNKLKTSIEVERRLL